MIKVTIVSDEKGITAILSGENLADEECLKALSRQDNDIVYLSHAVPVLYNSLPGLMISKTGANGWATSQEKKEKE